MLKLAALAVGSWKFWLCSALAAGAAAAVAVFTFVFATDPEDIGTRGYRVLGSDRVLLMNRDDNSFCPIDYQGYSDTSTKNNTYWKHVKNSSASMYNLEASYNSVLWQKDPTGGPAKPIWELINCRHGNTYPTIITGDEPPLPYGNYMSQSPTGYYYGDRTFPVEFNADAGQIVFRNTPEAQVVSSCYTNGIGTIYVDAVNGFTGSPEYTDNSIAIEVAYGVWQIDESGRVKKVNPKLPDDIDWLETVDGTPVSQGGIPVPPDDEHCHEVVFADDTTNLYGRCAWMPAKVTGRRYESGAMTTVTPTENVRLDITAGQSMDNFYRLWAPIQDPAVNPVLAKYCNGPLRFRIKRTDDPTGYKAAMGDTVIEADDLDGKNAKDLKGKNQKYNALILLDNVIASLPAMKAGAVAKGEYVPTKARNTVGWTGALSVKYPAIGETGVKASAGVFAVSNNPPDQLDHPIDFNSIDWVKRATMKYRWRSFNRIVPGWDDPELAGEFILDTKTADGLESSVARTMPNLVGDVEFYYSAELDAPYYAYVDYSGSTTITGTPGYRERIKEVQTRLDPKKIGTDGLPPELPSGGTDFFFRLREGKSDQLGYVLEMRKKGTTAPVTKTDFSLVGTRAWRAYYQTLTNETNSAVEMEFRVVGENPSSTWGEKDETRAVPGIPLSGHRLEKRAADDCWTSISVDALTGHLMFQLMEDDADVETMTEVSYSIVHADFQDFTHWGADATKGYFVGTYEDTTRRSGDSPVARDFTEDLAGWSARQAENPQLWTENFKDTSTPNWQPNMGYGGYKAYEAFGSCMTPNGWDAAMGMWVCGRFRESSATSQDMALQLAGQGFGSLTYTDTEGAPRGLDAVSFKARVAQYGNFGSFAVYGGSSLSTMKDYMFSASVALANKNVTADNFEGNGTVSLTAYHNPGIGCYEVRAERWGDNAIRLWLYKWEQNADGEIEATPLGYYNANLTYRNANSTYLEGSGSGGVDDTYAEIFIYCKTVSNSKVEVYAGIHDAGKKIATAVSAKKHYCIKYVDESSPYTSGTYGFGSMNCYARIINPQYYASAPTIAFTGTANWVTRTMCKPSGFSDGAPNVSFNGTGTPMFVESIGSQSFIYKDWSIIKGNWAMAQISGTVSGTKVTYEGVRAKAPANTVTVEIKAPSTGDKWKGIPGGTNTVSSFSYKTFEMPLHTRDKAAVRFKVGGKSTGTRTDVVVDDVKMKQWCAANFDDKDITDFDDKIPGFGCPTNFVYVNGWVNVLGDVHTVDLQPTRAQAGVAMGVRGPLMDGEKFGDTVCGLGLGSVSYTYANADSRCRVLVQWKDTKGSASSLASDTKSTEGWITVATNDFSQLPASGTVTTYVGLRAQMGVMRIVVDPEVVRAATAAGQTDLNYGRITVKGLLFRDEPPMDDRCWWGWNLQARTNADELLIYDLDASVQGRALALNDSVDRDISPDPAEKENYTRHVPFVQSPKFAANVVGEISFRARKMNETDPIAQVTVLAAKNSEDDDQYWTPVYSNFVDSTVYRTFTWKAKAGNDYAAFRVAVVGLDGIVPPGKDYKEVRVAGPVRILLDDVSVSEAIRGKIGLFDVGAFRKPLDTHEYIDNLFDITQQPMCEESWSVQCEVRPTQLAEEIRLDDETEVIFHWYRGDKWGFGAWQGDPKAKSAKLARIKDRAGFVFRGSYPEASGAIVEPIYDSGAVVQYMLEVKYKLADGSDADPFYLEAYDGAQGWKKPTWYRGVDYNATRGGFAAYTILDKVAYGYAWINEVNFYDGPSSSSNTGRTNQYVEVAMPAEASLDRWKLQFITGGLADNDAFYTNTVATFRLAEDGTPGVIPPRKPENRYLDEDSGYVFLTACSPYTLQTNPGLKADRYVDGTWKVGDDFYPYQEQLKDDGTVSGGYPIGVRLVRPSGIIEDEIVVIGTNIYARLGEWEAAQHSPTNFVNRLRKAERDDGWYFTGEDDGSRPTFGRSVTNQFATSEGDWAYWPQTPGRINAYGDLKQYIASDHPRPYATMLILYANLENGHIVQSYGDYTNVAENLVLYIPKELPNGTNIVYEVADWHEIEAITETVQGKAPKVSHVGDRGRFSCTVAVNETNDTVRLVAATRVRSDLVDEYDLDPVKNPYANAVVAWLEGNATSRDGGTGFKFPGGAIELARLEGLDGVDRGEMSLTDMYWFDMDPTWAGQVFRMGLIEAPSEKPAGGRVPYEEDDEGGGKVTNLVMQVFMMISNRVDETFVPYAPYTLNGRKPHSSSAVDSSDWDSETFKITGIVNNGKTSFIPPSAEWLPLRYFVFGPDSFRDFKATIEIMDPFSPQSPAYYQGWDVLKGKPTFFSFSIDTRVAPVTPEVLNWDSTFDE